MELLWPEQSPGVSSKRLQVVLSHLRKILEPDLSRGVPSAYIIREGSGYRLSLGEQGSIDCERFSGLLQKGRKEKTPDAAVTWFKQAESVYKGDFLEEDLYADWCSLERNRLKTEYLSLLSLLMKHYEREKNHAACVDYAEKYLVADPYAENIYRRLMLFHAQNNSPEQIQIVYERCKRYLTEGLGCSLSSETERFYHQNSKKTKIHPA